VLFVVASKKKLFKKRWLKRLVWTVVIIAIVALTLAVALFPNLRSVRTTGKYSVDSLVVELEDTSRLENFRNDGSFRKISIEAYYPASGDIGKGDCALVVFSHGGISLGTSNESLYKGLASHGYVVVSIAHTYHALSTRINGKRILINSGYMNELNSEDFKKDIENSYDCYQKWMKLRTDDINFIIDTLIDRAATEDTSFYRLIDATRIGLSGHSLGGAAVLGVARQRNDIKAVIALESPFMCDIIGVDGDAFVWNTEPYQCAIMNIYSDTGYPLIESDNTYIQNKSYLYNSENVEYYYIEGSNHFTLTDLVRTSPALCALLGGGYSKSGYETLQFINEVSVAFFDKYMTRN
jgi:hypothetical protein